jgi:hypothetical protein
MKLSFISLSLFIVMMSINLVGGMLALIQIRYFINCLMDVWPLSCWSLYVMQILFSHAFISLIQSSFGPTFEKFELGYYSGCKIYYTAEVVDTPC